MDQRRFDSISFEDALAISQRRYKETSDEVRDLRRELRDRDARLQAILAEQCALKQKNRELTEALRKIESGLALQLRENPSLLDGLASMATPARKVQNIDDAVDVLNGMQLCPVDAVQALVSNKTNYIARLPFEMRGDILLNLDRFSLDRAGFACPQFHAVVGCLVGGSLRVLTSVRLNVRNPKWDDWGTARPRRFHRPAGRESVPPVTPASSHFNCQNAVGMTLVAEEQYEFGVSVDYYSDPMALKYGSTGGKVNRHWSFSDIAIATSHFVGLLRHASVQELNLSGPLPIHLLEALSSADVDVTVESLNVAGLLLTSEHLALGRSALTSFSLLRKLTLGHDVPLSFVTDEFLVALKNSGVAKFEFRSRLFTVQNREGWAIHIDRRVLSVGYNGTYPFLDAGVMTFLFDGDANDQKPVSLVFPAARVPKEFCKRILERAMVNESRNPLMLSFVAVIDELIVELEGFKEFAEDVDDDVIVYKVPQSPASDMLLELKIIRLEDAPNRWRAEDAPNNCKLVEFRRYKKPPHSTYVDEWGDGGDGFGNGGFGGVGWGGGGDQWA